MGQPQRAVRGRGFGFAGGGKVRTCAFGSRLRHLSAVQQVWVESVQVHLSPERSVQLSEWHLQNRQTPGTSGASDLEGMTINPFRRDQPETAGTAGNLRKWNETKSSVQKLVCQLKSGDLACGQVWKIGFYSIEEDKQRKRSLLRDNHVSKAAELIGPGEVKPSGSPCSHSTNFTFNRRREVWSACDDFSPGVSVCWAGRKECPT